eukprot:9140116-Alexandrium_andersonii.AAC.1
MCIRDSLRPLQLWLGLVAHGRVVHVEPVERALHDLLVACHMAAPELAAEAHWLAAVSLGS